MFTGSRQLAAAALFAAVAAFALVGCGSDDCANDAECGLGRYCQAGTCANYCASDLDCPPGRFCDDGYCVTPTRCTGQEDCPSGTSCESGICVRQEAECRLNSECPPNFTCCEGGCYPPGSESPACLAACAEDRDCAEGEQCADGRCTPDVGPDAGPDTDASDVSDDPDTADDVAEDPAEDVAPDTTPDTTPDSAPDIEQDTPPDADSDATEDAAPDTPPDTDRCEGRDDGQLGERCVAAADCCNGLCFGNADAGLGVCTDVCDSYRDCNPVGGAGTELFCYREPTIGAPLCAVSDYGESCFDGGDCIDGRCLVSASSRQCTYRCDSTADCPSGEACGLVNFDVGGTEAPQWVCTPIGGTPCLPSSDCLSGTCLYDDETGVGYCSTICDADDAAACPSPFVCTELPDGVGGVLPVCVLPGT